VHFVAPNLTVPVLRFAPKRVPPMVTVAPRRADEGLIVVVCAVVFPFANRKSVSGVAGIGIACEYRNAPSGERSPSISLRNAISCVVWLAVSVLPTALNAVA